MKICSALEETKEITSQLKIHVDPQDMDPVVLEPH